ncbi:MAG TPA: acylphosphatase [Nakamurella sp.]
MRWFGRSPDEAEATPDRPEPGTVRMTAFVHGYVQGVGFRWYTRTRAMDLGLVGSATNLADGRVEVVVEGPQQACDDLLAWLRHGKTPGSVDQVVAQFAEARGAFRGFGVG